MITNVKTAVDLARPLEKSNKPAPFNIRASMKEVVGLTSVPSKYGRFKNYLFFYLKSFFSQTMHFLHVTLTASLSFSNPKFIDKQSKTES